jgi:outer membrane protein OmpA-like peptidoglycan-associated protein
MSSRHRQHGAAMAEFIVVGSVLTLLGLAILQYGLLFFAKNQMNHAAFMAARAASMSHASLDQAKEAYIKAMVPMYGGGRDATELLEAYGKAKADIEAHTTIEMLNPTKESFEDFNDPTLQAVLGKGKGKDGADARVIPNTALYARKAEVKDNSGQTIQDANILKLRITQDYEPKVPLMKPLFGERVAVVNVVTVQMQTDAIEPQSTVSSPGKGNNGTPVDPAPPQPPASSPIPGDPAQTPAPGATPPGTPSCPEGQTLVETAQADVLFDFDKSTLNDSGKQTLDALIEQAKQQRFESLTITGFTDPLGSDAYNNKLSLDRAAAVRDYLQSHGFPNKPITVQGKGATELKKSLTDCPAGAQCRHRRHTYQPQRQLRPHGGRVAARTGRSPMAARRGRPRDRGKATGPRWAPRHYDPPPL